MVSMRLEEYVTTQKNPAILSKCNFISVRSMGSFRAEIMLDIRITSDLVG